QSGVSERTRPLRFQTHRRRQLRLSETRQANGRQRRRHVETQRFPFHRHRPPRNHRDRRQRKGPRARPRNSRRHHNRLSLLHIRIFPPRQRQHEPRRIPPTRRKAEERHRRRKPRPRHLHLHGLRQSL